MSAFELNFKFYKIFELVYWDVNKQILFSNLKNFEFYPLTGIESTTFYSHLGVRSVLGSTSSKWPFPTTKNKM